MWLVLLMTSAVGAVLSPEDLGLRSSVPGVPGLLEPSDPLTEPKPQDLNATILAAKLGTALDLEFMSLNKPSKKDQLMITPHFNFRRSKNGRLVPIGPMPKHVKDLELGVIKLADGSKLRTRVPSRLKRKLRQLLWALTACPVGYRWKDLGPRFWPRWLKEGTCPRTTCSVPPGMKCRPAASEHKTLLRWHCRKGCQWIKVQYPVVTQCACACSSSSSSSSSYS